MKKLLHIAYIGMVLCLSFMPKTADANPNYKLTIGDDVILNVTNESDFNRRYTISEQGTINIPIIGDVVLEGLTSLEAQNKIRTKLSDGYLINPIVSLKHIITKKFYILGEIRNPGSYQYENGLTALDAINTAGGFTFRANKKQLQLLRPKNKTNPNSEDVYELIPPKTPLESGDILLVKEKFF